MGLARPIQAGGRGLLQIPSAEEFLVPTLWNTLPPKVRTTPILLTFQKGNKSWFCQCEVARGTSKFIQVIRLNYCCSVGDPDQRDTKAEAARSLSFEGCEYVLRPRAYGMTILAREQGRKAGHVVGPRYQGHLVGPRKRASLWNVISREVSLGPHLVAFQKVSKTWFCQQADQVACLFYCYPHRMGGLNYGGLSVDF